LSGKIKLTDVEYEEIKYVMREMKNRKMEATKVRDYNLLSILEKLIQQAYLTYQNSSYFQDRDGKRNLLQVQYETAKTQKEDLARHWQDVKDEMNAKYTEQKNALIQKHKEELNKHENSYPEILPAEYRKFSVALLQMRAQEQFLVFTKRYDEAGAMMTNISALETKELQQQKDKFNKDFDLKKAQMQQAQAKEMACFEKHWKLQFEEAEQRSQKELNSCDQSVQNFERRLNAVQDEERTAQKSTKEQPKKICHPLARTVHGIRGQKEVTARNSSASSRKKAQ
jgi:hypothetical protein